MIKPMTTITNFLQTSDETRTECLARPDIRCLLYGDEFKPGYARFASIATFQTRTAIDCNVPNRVAAHRDITYPKSFPIRALCTINSCAA